MAVGSPTTRKGGWAGWEPAATRAVRTDHRRVGRVGSNGAHTFLTRRPRYRSVSWAVKRVASTRAATTPSTSKGCRRDCAPSGAAPSWSESEASLSSATPRCLRCPDQLSPRAGQALRRGLRAPRKRPWGGIRSPSMRRHPDGATALEPRRPDSSCAPLKCLYLASRVRLRCPVLRRARWHSSA